MRLPLLLLLITGLFFASCGDYQKVLRKDDMAKKYAYADSLYQKKKYKKALKLMEQLVPAYRGKPQAQKLMFIYANTYYELGDYFQSGYQFERFVQAYPQSDSVEVAFFRSAKSFYNLSERYSLDQQETYRGMEKLQAFINAYPNSDLREMANQMVVELRTKLERKKFEVVKQYYRLEAPWRPANLKAAIASADNFIKDNPGSIFREEAFLIRLKAAHELAINSIPTLKEERLRDAEKHYNSYIRYFKDGEFSKEANEIHTDIEKRLAAYNQETTI